MSDRYRIGYIDDEPEQYENYKRKINRRCEDLELVLLDGCATKEEFLDSIYENQIDVVLIDFRMAASFGFNGTTLINYINDHVRDLECFILTAVDQEQITDGLVAGRNRYSKDVFNTAEGSEEDEKDFRDFLEVMRESAEVYRRRREQKTERYRELLEKKRNHAIGVEEEEFLGLYKVLSSYGLVEKLPTSMLNSEFEDKLDRLLHVGEKIIEEHHEE